MKGGDYHFSFNSSSGHKKVLYTQNHHNSNNAFTRTTNLSQCSFSIQVFPHTPFCSPHRFSCHPSLKRDSRQGRLTRCQHQYQHKALDSIASLMYITLYYTISSPKGAFKDSPNAFIVFMPIFQISMFLLCRAFTRGFQNVYTNIFQIL